MLFSILPKVIKNDSKTHLYLFPDFKVKAFNVSL